MDIIQYISNDDDKLRTLAKRSRLQIVRLKRLIADPAQPVRYMTARRLHAASDGEITLEALSARGPMRGVDTFDGPLGQAIAASASTGPDIPSRLAASGIGSDHFTEVLLRGRVPAPERVHAYAEAFGPDITRELFVKHAEWRRKRAAGGDAA